MSALPAAWLAVRGRAADRDRPVPFRAVAEAMLAASRHGALPDDPDVHAFAAALGRLVPAWRRGAVADEPVVVVTEAVLRVLRALAAPGPAVMLIEDAQWADPETLAVLEYFAGNVAGQQTAIVITVRSDTPVRACRLSVSWRRGRWRCWWIWPGRPMPAGSPGSFEERAHPCRYGGWSLLGGVAFCAAPIG